MVIGSLSPGGNGIASVVIPVGPHGHTQVASTTSLEPSPSQCVILTGEEAPLAGAAQFKHCQQPFAATAIGPVHTEVAIHAGPGKHCIVGAVELAIPVQGGG
jgi:hypothetical protein